MSYRYLLLGLRPDESVSFSHRPMSYIFLALFTVLLLNARTASAEGTVGPTESEMVGVMERHYEEAIFSHDALVQGDLEMLRERLSRLAKLELPATAPESWRPYHARLQEVASSGASSISSLQGAGAVMADVAEACGSCHAALKVENIYFRPAPPDGEAQLKSAMRSHQWASERLWEGVTGPFEEAWPRGADAIADSHIFGDEGEAVKAGLRAREDALRQLGRKARATTGLHERAVIYGRLLTTCAACHQESGVSIAPAKSLPPWRE